MASFMSIPYPVRQGAASVVPRAVLSAALRAVRPALQREAP
jgi:hypothetical protein